MTDLAGSLTENLIDCIEALGAARPQSKGLSELYQALATALSTFSTGIQSISDTFTSNPTLTPNTPLILWSVSPSIGTWLFTLQVTVSASATGSVPTAYAVGAAGSPTLSGKYQAEAGGSLVVGQLYELNCSFLAIVTSDVTDINLNVQSNEADTVLSSSDSLVALTGYTAIKLT